MKAKWLSVCVLVLLMAVARTVESQTLLTQTTWGGAGADVADGVATAADGSSYVRVQDLCGVTSELGGA